jgi:hypothetical protein
MHIGVVEVEVVLVVVLVEVGQRMSAPHSSDCKPPCGAQKATQTGCASEPLQVSEHKLKDELSIQLHTNKAPPSGGTHKPTLPEQRPLQQSVLVQKVLPPAQVQDPPFGWHIGVVDVEVVLVDVDVVVVLVVEVLVVLLVEVVLVVGAAVVVVVVFGHSPLGSPCLMCASCAFLLEKHSVFCFVGSPAGLWQTQNFFFFLPSARAREGIRAAMAVPAKSLRALRRLIDPSARARARSSKERLVDSWLTCCPLPRRARR